MRHTITRLARILHRALSATALSLAAPLAVHSQAIVPPPLPPEEHFRVPVGPGGLEVYLRHQPSSGQVRPAADAPVLFVHGASFPSGLAAGFKFVGVSWMEDLAARGFDVWALDFLGYGKSDRYPEMREPALAHSPLGRAPEAARQIEAAVNFIAGRRRLGSSGVNHISLVAHSWGTIPAGLYAGDQPTRVERLVLFGPVARRTVSTDPSTGPAYWFVTEEEQRTRFLGYVPQGEARVLEPHHLDVWGPAYMATDSTSGTRTPPSVQVPYGPIADLEAAWSGRLPYDPAKIIAPVLIIRGEWEEVTPDADARWLYDALTHAALKRDVKISRATHVMHLERARYQLYSEVAAFLAGHDLPPAAAPGASTEAGH